MTTKSTTETASAKPVIRAVEHTPTPWRVMEMHGESTVFDTGAPTLIARCGKSHQSQARANAAYIVRAVNCHDDLLEACKRLIKLVEDLNGDAIMSATLDEANETIAKSEESQ